MAAPRLLAGNTPTSQCLEGQSTPTSQFLKGHNTMIHGGLTCQTTTIHCSGVPATSVGLNWPAGDVCGAPSAGRRRPRGSGGRPATSAGLRGPAGDVLGAPAARRRRPRGSNGRPATSAGLRRLVPISLSCQKTWNRHQKQVSTAFRTKVINLSQIDEI